MHSLVDDKNMRLTYNAPLTLSLSIIMALVFFADAKISNSLITNYFTLESKDNFDVSNLFGYIKLFSYVFGHGDLTHLTSNLMILLLIGPLIEERYGFGMTFWMIFFVAGLNGFVNILFFHSQLIGASGIVFMMMLLSSFVNVRKGDIPLTFICIIALYLSKEIKAFYDASHSIGDISNVSNISHLVGGLCGAIFGFLEGSWKQDRNEAEQFKAYQNHR